MPAALGLLASIWFGRAAADDEDREHAFPLVRAVLMETDRRANPEAYALNSGIGTEELHRRYGASGLVRCGESVGSGQLTLRNDVITTAAHVLYDPEGRLRSTSCVFEPMPGAGGEPVELDLNSIKAGSKKPYAEPATRDWAVVRLVAPVEGARPYRLGAAGREPLPVFMCAGGNGRGNVWGAERCSTRRITAVSKDGIRELAIDCSADHGSSGAALVSDRNDIVAIYVGYRSIDPKRARPFSPTHYNFGITIDGPFRRALQEIGDTSSDVAGH